MPVTHIFYGVPVKNQYDGTAVIDWDTDTIKLSLHTSTYTPAQDTDDFWNDATAEVSGTGYTTGGVTLGGKSITYDTGSNEIRFVASDAQWTSSSFTARHGVIYKSTGTAATSPLFSNINFGGDNTVSSATFTIDFDASALAKVTVSA